MWTICALSASSSAKLICKFSSGSRQFTYSILHSERGGQARVMALCGQAHPPSPLNLTEKTFTNEAYEQPSPHVGLGRQTPHAQCPFHWAHTNILQHGQTGILLIPFAKLAVIVYQVQVSSPTHHQNHTSAPSNPCRIESNRTQLPGLPPLSISLGH